MNFGLPAGAMDNWISSTGRRNQPKNGLRLAADPLRLPARGLRLRAEAAPKHPKNETIAPLRQGSVSTYRFWIREGLLGT